MLGVWLCSPVTSWCPVQGVSLRKCMDFANAFQFDYEKHLQLWDFCNIPTLLLIFLNCQLQNTCSQIISVNWNSFLFYFNMLKHLITCGDRRMHGLYPYSESLEW